MMYAGEFQGSGVARDLMRVRVLPVVTSALCSGWGLLFLKWSVADLYFWFWYEFTVAGLMLFALLLVWNRFEPKWDNVLTRGMSPLWFLVAFGMVLFYATLFAILAYMGEWKSWHNFPKFLAGKEVMLAATFIAFALFFATAVASRDHGVADSGFLSTQFLRRSFVVIGVYFVMIERYHLVDGATLVLSPDYMKFLGGTLLALKAGAEAGLFDRFARVRSTARP
jgi:hypothetical protein